LKSVNIVRRESAVPGLGALTPDAVLVDGPDLPARIREVCGDNLPKLAIDAVAGDITERMADGIADGGVVVNYGLLSGQPCTMRADQLIFRQQKLVGFWLGQSLTTMKREDVEDLYLELADLVRNGMLNVPVEATYPIEDIAMAAKHANQGGREGKILVLPNGPLGG
ncbi:MAG TPA: zinc-binding dehydrogenase, partial [Alphaproteobacteria bacterium]|nr:zinc-binding dehydrogenase [Alphaproteobacteria bacterium]